MIQCGIAGTGRGASYVDPLEKNRNTELRSICAAKPGELSPYGKYRTFTDFDEFIDSGLDLIILATPGPLHAAQSVTALERGIHVLCETPAVYNEEEALLVRKAAERGNAHFMLSENYLWMGYFKKLTEMKEQGLLGEIFFAEGSYLHDLRNMMLETDDGYIPYNDRSLHPGARKSWRAENLPPILYTSHLNGPILTLMEDRITAAECRGTPGKTAPELGIPDLQTALFNTEKGNMIRLSVGFTLAHPFSFTYSFIGTAGTVILENRGAARLTWYSDQKGDGWKSENIPFVDREDGKGEAEAMIDSVADNLLEQGTLPLSFTRSMDFTLPGAAAVQSWMNSGKPVDVPLI